MLIFFVQLVLPGEETFCFLLVKELLQRWLPSLVSFHAILVLLLLLQGKYGLLNITPLPAGTVGHSLKQLESRLGSANLRLSTPGWQEASCVSSPGSDERRGLGERNAHTKVGFYKCISLKMYSDSCLHHADWGVVCLSWKAVEKVALVFCFVVFLFLL